MMTIAEAAEAWANYFLYEFECRAREVMREMVYANEHPIEDVMALYTKQQSAKDKGGDSHEWES